MSLENQIKSSFTKDNNSGLYLPFNHHFNRNISRREFLKWVGSSVVIAAFGTACTENVNGGGTDYPGTDRIDGSPSDYASSIGLPLDVSILDNNDNVLGGAFTNHERDWIDVLKAISNEGKLTDNELQDTIEHHHKVGPMAVKALALSYKGYLEDKIHEPDVIHWTPTQLGWIPMDKIMPDSSLPAYNHANSESAITNYPINTKTTLWGPPDWTNLIQGVTSTFLSEMGACPNCNLTQDVFMTGSLDMLMRREFQDGDLQKLYYPVYNGTLTPGKVLNIVINRMDDGAYFGEFDEAGITVEYKVHPDDRSVMNVSKLFYIYSHLSPNNERYFTLDDFPFRTGDNIPFGTFLGYISHYLGPFELDFTISTVDNIGFGPYLTPPPGGIPENEFILDILGSRYYPERKQPKATQPRYSQDHRILAPFPLREGGYIPEPSNP